MSGNLGPGRFVILWMIQLGTWREKVWGKVSESLGRALRFVRDVWEARGEDTCTVGALGRALPGAASRAAAPPGLQALAARGSARVPAARLPSWRPAAGGGALSAPDLLRTGLHNRKPARVCFVLLHSLARSRTRPRVRVGAAGSDWVAAERSTRARSPPPRDPPLVALRSTEPWGQGLGPPRAKLGG